MYVHVHVHVHVYMSITDWSSCGVCLYSQCGVIVKCVNMHTHTLHTPPHTHPHTLTPSHPHTLTGGGRFDRFSKKRVSSVFTSDSARKKWRRLERKVSTKSGRVGEVLAVSYVKNWTIFTNLCQSLKGAKWVWFQLCSTFQQGKIVVHSNTRSLCTVPGPKMTTIAL